MKSFSTFSFYSYAFDYEKLVATFSYRFDEEVFTETVHFSTPVRAMRMDIDEAVIDELLKHIHIAVGISYYKLSPTAKVQVPEWRTEEMLKFWQMFYVQGLGEFMVVNGLSPTEVAKFAVEPLEKSPLPPFTKGGVKSKSRNMKTDTLLFF
ncbi:MAG: hypothetical protein LBU27_05510 [Candidatus Peribacteria bacterium]|jgi:hypothetical protein|nr:hypothetical protein [Candidatus Peribacteria bacterium]